VDRRLHDGVRPLSGTGRTPRALAVAVALAAALVLSGCGSQNDDTEIASADLQGGKELFVERCGSCHTLADAGTQGQVGPNLDWGVGYPKLQGFEEDTLFEVVLQQIDLPNESGGMPADLVTGQDAVDVAAYVAGAADASAAPAEAQQDGEAIFTANCGSCHTLAAAGTSGTVGPNLDQAGPSKELAVDRVTNGAGAMPAFAGTLTEEQIDAVATYVAENAG
jgi:cbb3-type cytochrome c oxidase subunit III